MRKKILSILALLCLTAGSAWAQWTGGTYTATGDETLSSIIVARDATLTINAGVTVTVNEGLVIEELATLTVKGPGSLVVNGRPGSDGREGISTIDGSLIHGGDGNKGGTAIDGNIIIMGATVTATGGNGGNGGKGGIGDDGDAGIDKADENWDGNGNCGDDGGTGGNGGDGGSAFTSFVTILQGSNVTATGGQGGRGGEGGEGGTGGLGSKYEVNSNGGAGGTGGKGGGGGTGGSGFAGSVTLHAGSVTATGGRGGDGGNGGRGGDGGNGMANCGGGGGTGGDGISGGYGGHGVSGTLGFFGGQVKATGGDGGNKGKGGTGGQPASGSTGTGSHGESGPDGEIKGPNGLAFFNGVDFVNTPTTLTDGTNNIAKDQVTGYQTVNISGPAAIYNVTADLADGAYWSTFYSNEGNYQAPENTQVFAVNLTGTKLTMIEIPDRIVKSGEGVVLKNPTTGSITMTLTEATPAGDFSANSLKGTMTPIETTGPMNYYVLNTGPGDVGFYKLSGTSGFIGANMAYLTYDGAEAPEFLPFDEDSADAVVSPFGETEEGAGAIYNLAGQRIQKMQRGVNIVNGKKVLK